MWWLHPDMSENLLTGILNHKTNKERKNVSPCMRIGAFVFATRIVQCLHFLNPKFPASSHLLCLYSSVCVESVCKPHCWFSHDKCIVWLQVRMQARCNVEANETMLQAFKKIYRQEGIPGLWRVREGFSSFYGTRP